MTWLKFGIAALALSFGISAAGAFEIVDLNNGFAGPQFTSLPDEGSQDTGPSFGYLNTDNFMDGHIVMKGGHEKEFDGFSYSGFVFEDQLKQPTISIDQSSVVSVPDAGKLDAKR